MNMTARRGLIRGRIYVLRSVDGQIEALALVHQADYKEWAGCFSALGD